MTDLKIYITRVKGYDFEGYVYESDLSEAQCDYLRITRSEDTDPEIRVRGEVTVYAEPDSSTVECDSLWLSHGDRTLDLDPAECNLDSIYEAFEESYCDYYSEQQSEWADHMRKSIKEDGE